MSDYQKMIKSISTDLQMKLKNLFELQNLEWLLSSEEYWQYFKCEFKKGPWTFYLNITFMKPILAEYKGSTRSACFDHYTLNIGHEDFDAAVVHKINHETLEMLKKAPDAQMGNMPFIEERALIQLKIENPLYVDYGNKSLAYAEKRTIEEAYLGSKDFILNSMDDEWKKICYLTEGDNPQNFVNRFIELGNLDLLFVTQLLHIKCFSFLKEPQLFLENVLKWFEIHFFEKSVFKLSETQFRDFYFNAQKYQIARFKDLLLLTGKYDLFKKNEELSELTQWLYVNLKKEKAKNIHESLTQQLEQIRNKTAVYLKKLYKAPQIFNYEEQKKKDFLNQIRADNENNKDLFLGAKYALRYQPGCDYNEICIQQYCTEEKFTREKILDLLNLKIVGPAPDFIGHGIYIHDQIIDNEYYSNSFFEILVPTFLLEQIIEALVKNKYGFKVASYLPSEFTFYAGFYENGRKKWSVLADSRSQDLDSLVIFGRPFGLASRLRDSKKKDVIKISSKEKIVFDRGPIWVACSLARTIPLLPYSIKHWGHHLYNEKRNSFEVQLIDPVVN